MSDALEAQFAKLPSEICHFESGAILFRRGDPVRWLFRVERGVAQLVRYQESGSMSVIQRTDDGSFLAEASLFSACYHCDGLVTCPTQMTRYRKDHVIQAMRDGPDFAALWAQYLSREVQRMRARAEILSLHTVEARLNAWLSLYERPLPAKGEWVGLATELGVTPEALYRCLARRPG